MAIRLSGITGKMTFAIGFAVIATALSMTFVTRYIVTLTFGLSLSQRLDETSKMVRSSLGSLEEGLGARTSVYVKDPEVGKQHSYKNWDPAEKWIDSQIAQKNISVAMMTNGDEVVIDRAKGKIKPAALAASTALTVAKRTQADAIDVEMIGGQLAIVAASPVFNYDQNRGYLVVAKEIDDASLAKLKEASGADVMILTGDGVNLGTRKVDFANAHLPSVWQSLSAGAALVPMEGLRTDEGELRAAAFPVQADKHLQAGVVFALSDAESMKLRKRVTRSSISLAALIALLAGAIGFFLARRVSGPIIEIERSFSEIAASGDLSRRITRGYGDEVGLLATAFNKMQDQIEGLHRRATEAEQRMRDELQTAAAVQEMLFPSTTVDGVRCQYAGHCFTCTEIGGDWYAILNNPERNSTTVIVADVTGHGAPAALVTAILHGFFKAVRSTAVAEALAQGSVSEASILQTLNRAMIESTRGARMLTLAMYTFDHSTLKLRYANAGHPAPLVAHRQPDGEYRVNMPRMAPSPQIGDVQDPVFTTFELQLTPGDVIVLYTDGLIECENDQQEQFGMKRLRASIGRYLTGDARSIRDGVLREAFGFFGDAPRADDITLVAAKVL